MAEKVNIDGEEKTENDHFWAAASSLLSQIRDKAAQFEQYALFDSADEIQKLSFCQIYQSNHGENLITTTLPSSRILAKLKQRNNVNH